MTSQKTTAKETAAKWKSYDYLIRQAYYSLDHPEGKSLSFQSPLYRLKTQIAERYLGKSLKVYTTY